MPCFFRARYWKRDIDDAHLLPDNRPQKLDEGGAAPAQDRDFCAFHPIHPSIYPLRLLRKRPLDFLSELGCIE